MATDANNPGGSRGRKSSQGSRGGGKVIGQYTIQSELGRGGMGVVYKAHDRALDRTVAIKVLPGHLAEDRDFGRRFVREARAAAKLDHPGIVQVYQVGKTEETLFIAMQYVDAKPLSKIISEEELDHRWSLSVVKQVAEALGHAHEAGIVHRDIKPSNIMVDEKGRARVMDFGLAKQLASDKKITHTGSYIGTPEYSSPEQCETVELDGRSDIYSLGVVFYEMLAGRVPFSAQTPLKLFEKICYDEPEPISRVAAGVPKEVAKLLGKMMAKEREDRYQDCAELVADIEKIERGESLRIESRKRIRAARARRRSSSLTPVLGVVAALTIMAAGYFYVTGRSPEGVRTTDGPGTSTPAAGPAARPRTAERRKVMVRDFENFTGEADLDWLSIGIADMLITDLAGCDFLEVLGREKARSITAGGRKKPVGVHIELKGSFAKAGRRIQVMVQMLDLEGGTVLRAVKASGSEDEVFALVDAVSSRIRSNLETMLADRLGEPVKLASAEGGVAGRLFVASARGRDLAKHVATRRPAAKYGRDEVAKEQASSALRRSAGKAGRSGAAGGQVLGEAAGGADRKRALSQKGLAEAKERDKAEAHRSEALKAEKKRFGGPASRPRGGGGAGGAARPVRAGRSRGAAPTEGAAATGTASLQTGAAREVEDRSVGQEALNAVTRQARTLPAPAPAPAAPREPGAAASEPGREKLAGKAKSRVDKIAAATSDGADTGVAGIEKATAAKPAAPAAPAAAPKMDAARDGEARRRAVKKQVMETDLAETRPAQVAPAEAEETDAELANAGAARHARMRAVRSYYSAKRMLESRTGDPGLTTQRALELLLKARELAPGLRGIDDEIDACRKRLESME